MREGEKSMLCKKFLTCLVSMLFVTSALIAITNVKNDTIIVSGDSCPENNGEIGLNYNYMWNVTTNLSNAVHKYPSGMIPKGRAFGSWGCENYSKNYILGEMNNMSLEKI